MATASESTELEHFPSCSSLPNTSLPANFYRWIFFFLRNMGEVRFKKHGTGFDSNIQLNSGGPCGALMIVTRPVPYFLNIQHSLFDAAYVRVAQLST